MTAAQGAVENIMPRALTRLLRSQAIGGGCVVDLARP